jgi:hypothetical protein
LPGAEGETDELQLLRGLELGELTPQQLHRLKHSPLMDPARFSQEEVDHMRADLLQARMKPVVFEPRRHYVLNAARLFQQLERALARTQAGKAPRDLLHNFKRDSAMHRKLFDWAPLETVRGLLGPVHHQIFVCGAQAQAERPRPRAPLTSRVELQNALIHSHWQPYPHCPCALLVHRLEVLLNAVLQRVLVQQKLRCCALFVLEWSEAPRFQCVVCIDVAEPVRKTNNAMDVDEKTPKTPKTAKTPKKKKSEEETAVVELARTDLFDDLAPVDHNEHSALRLLLRDGRPSYRFHAFARRDDADRL